MRLTTTDLYESSWLHCCGAKLARAWVDRGRRNNTVVFLFEGDEIVRTLQETYHNGLAEVNLTEYRHSLETMKDMMFRLLRDPSSAFDCAVTRENKNQNQRGIIHHDTHSTGRA